jgi:hypothetical protein
MMLIREWFAEWAQAYFVRRGYDPVNRLINVLGGLLIIGALGIVAADTF